MHGKRHLHKQTQLNSTENTHPSDCNTQPFGELLGSFPDLPSWGLPMGCFSRALLPLLHSSSMGIPANDCSYQNQNSEQALGLQDTNICTVNAAPRATLVQPGKRHLTCLPRKTTPLQTNTHKSLPCTPKDQLFTEIKQQILLGS